MIEKLKDRLTHCRKSIGLTQKEFARNLGVSEPTMNHYEAGKRVPNAEFLARLAELLKCDPGWLLTGQGNSPGDATTASVNASGTSNAIPAQYVYVPRFQWDPGTDPQNSLQSKQIVDHLAFRLEWVRKELDADPSDLILVSNTGDAMEPTLRSGDLLLVHCLPGKVNLEGIYLMAMPKGLCIRRIEWQSEGTVTLSVDNPKVSKRELLVQNQGVLGKVVGRVVWVGRHL